jgi:hypothetical protein
MRDKRLNVSDVSSDKNFQSIFNNSQDINHRVVARNATPPNLSEVRENELVLYLNLADSKTYLYTKINISGTMTLRKVELT